MFGQLAASDNLLELLLNRLEVGYDDNGSWEEGEGSNAIAEIHSRCFCVVCHYSWKNLTNNGDGSTEHKEEGELGHCLSIQSVLSDILLNVAEADNGHSNADSYWYKASNGDPYGEESAFSCKDNDIAVIRETGHTIDELYFIHIRKHNVEVYSNGNKPEDGNDDCSTEQANGLLPKSHNCQYRNRECCQTPQSGR